MSISSDSAEQTIRLTLEGMEVVAKITGAAAKNIAVALYTIAQDQKKVSKGKTKLSNMIKSDNELKIFSIKKEDIKTFCYEAKRYGIQYCALTEKSKKGKKKDLNNQKNESDEKGKNIEQILQTENDNSVDIIVRAKDAPLVNRVIVKYNLCTHDKASIQAEIEREMSSNKNEKDLSNNVPDIGEERTEINEAMVDDIFSKPKENENQNPEVAKTEKNPPSEHSLKSINNSEGVTKPATQKESVKKKLKEAEAELKVETELKKAQKSKESISVDMLQIQTTQTPKIEIGNKERGK